jgi:DNA-binding NarL/FixJ family response regulator
MAIKIVIADDHTITREGLRSLLGQDADVEVVGEAQNGREAVALATTLLPDIVVMDITMPDLNGIDATRRIKERHPQIKVLALSMNASVELMTDMLKAGASGYVLKDCAFKELTEALRVVSEGGKHLSSKVTGMVVDDYISRFQEDGGISSVIKGLSSQEREVLQMVAEGKSTKEIAKILCKSTKAIEATRSRIMDKLDAHSVADLVRVAIARGLTPLQL